MTIAFAEEEPMAPLATAAELAGFRGAPFDEAAVHAASDSIRDECGWHIGPKLRSIIRFRGVKGTTLPILLLPTLRLIDVVSVTDKDGNPLYDLEWLPNGVLEREGGFPPWVEVTFFHGYTECPKALLPIIAERAVAASKGRIKSEALAGRSVSLDGGYDPASAAVLAKYKVNGGP